MFKEGKTTAEEKLQIVRDYLSGKTGYSDSAQMAEISKETLRVWIRIYEVEGMEGLKSRDKARKYSAILKEQAVRDYLSGQGSQMDICRKYRIRSKTQLQNWIAVYNRHEEFKTLTGGSRMTKGRETTKEERLAIAEECIAKGNNYGEIALKYAVSYQQVYTWVKKMKEQGETGLDDRRGLRLLDREPKTEEERLRQEIEQLKKVNYRLQMENDFIKKLKEVEGRGR